MTDKQKIFTSTVSAKMESMAKTREWQSMRSACGKHNYSAVGFSVSCLKPTKKIRYQKAICQLERALVVLEESAIFVKFHAFCARVIFQQGGSSLLTEHLVLASYRLARPDKARRGKRCPSKRRSHGNSERKFAASFRTSPCSRTGRQRSAFCPARRAGASASVPPPSDPVITELKRCGYHLEISRSCSCGFIRHEVLHLSNPTSKQAFVFRIRHVVI
ncbi:hypothetical protein QBC46DRAFT_24783 [Diplogelasinospora grovesii]|uniref:Uncharacterized protein n=1 Tax=Diplogelasinospora grovesii TaxID=303347 RepID=A0AAN6N1V8_9PEZI|nr:hypothetical protein QBC46DRAFT_24783 [Diplogelasinospora grovesii]